MDVDVGDEGRDDGEDDGKDRQSDGEEGVIETARFDASVVVDESFEPGQDLMLGLGIHFFLRFSAFGFGHSCSLCCKQSKQYTNGDVFETKSVCFLLIFGLVFPIKAARALVFWIKAPYSYICPFGQSFFLPVGPYWF